MAGLFDGSPPPRNSLLGLAQPKAPPDGDGLPDMGALYDAFHGGNASDAAPAPAYAPGDQLAQAQQPPSETADDTASPLPYPPPPRPNLVRLENVPIQRSRAIPYVHPTMVDKVTGFIDELRQNGIPALVTSAFRTPEKQAIVHGNKNGGVAPGRSLHEAGYAIDINWYSLKLTDDQKARVLEIAPKYGFRWGGTFSITDPGHFYVDPFGSLTDREEAIRATQQEFTEKR